MTILSFSAQAAPLVADLSNYRIDIDSGFNGTRIFLFGARNDNGDIVAVVRGPNKDYIVRKKEEVAGIWVNRDRMKFMNIPDFYAVASARPLTEIEQMSVARQLGIGEDNLLTPPADPKALAAYDPFAKAFLRHQRERGLYQQKPGVMQFMGETLFKTTIEFPDNIPPGDYTAEFYLLSDGAVVDMQSTPIKVVKSGIDAFLYSYAHEYPLLYGITAVLLALTIGWFTGKLFEHI
jgi:uncharacterized protein (TIGR02186 family)